MFKKLASKNILKLLDQDTYVSCYVQIDIYLVLHQSLLEIS